MSEPAKLWRTIVRDDRRQSRARFWKSFAWCVFGFFVHAAIGNAIGGRWLYFWADVIYLGCLLVFLFWSRIDD